MSVLLQDRGGFLRDLWIEQILRLITCDRWEMEGVDFREGETEKSEEAEREQAANIPKTERRLKYCFQMYLGYIFI